MEKAERGVDRARFHVVPSEAEPAVEEYRKEELAEFDSDVLEAFQRLGFRLGEGNKIEHSPRYVWYNVNNVPARVIRVLTDSKSRFDGAPMLELRTQPKNGREEKLFKLSVTSNWLERFEKKKK